jgi:hypothetical protein
MALIRRPAVAAIGSTFAALAALAVGPGAARAEESAAARRAAAAHERERPFAMAEGGVGFLALPAAVVCPKTSKDCSRGEFSLALGLRNLYRFQSFAVGAGIQWATTLRSDSARGADDLERDHSRRYFMVEVQGRYYPVRIRAWELWVGATLGGIVVNDSWTVKADREPYSDVATVGPRAATLGTEGLAAGVHLGAEWSFAPNWSFGPTLRYASWFFASKRAQSPTNDLASLSGRVDMFDLSAVIAYRIAL